MFNIILNIVHDSGMYMNIVHIMERGMFKTLFTLARGAAAAAAEEINDRHARLGPADPGCSGGGRARQARAGGRHRP